MSDFISREAAIEAARNPDDVCAKFIRARLRMLPAADVRPVVYCKDCIFASRDCEDFIYCKKLDEWEMPEEGYCHRARLRKEEQT